MAAVSIGVPVYNGAATLRSALECLRVQTFTDIEIIVSDNGSTDGSREIAAEFADRDSRFRLVHQPENVGARNNFRALIDLASSDLFMWRADDDLSSEDFVEVLKRLLDDHPDAYLAAPKSLLVAPDGTVHKVAPVEEPRARWRPMHVGRMLLGASPNWVYGLWRREALRVAMDDTGAVYPYLWAWDPLTVLPAVLDEAVAGSNDAVLFKLASPTPRYSSRVPAREMIAMRRAFRRACLAEFEKRKWGWSERPVLLVYVLRFANLRVYRFFKMLRRCIREKLGIIQA